ncbi:hypothetical protein BMG03_13785 [Thioclava nitratireducens]|uniref:Uncharacterized protein n=1 Tax=Thioclava nitratireducens TaxID=1915078 RepID=A0ABM6IJ11_9RHOB|nr:hypothetical protein [Thioclava nitratireducens]AQS48745.1 hypothetical protein BMG03_13785 [Thioclava nitratireducens]
MKNSSKIKKKLNYDAFRKANQQRLKKINDIVVEAHLAIQGLQILAKQMPQNKASKSGETVFELDVPSTKKARTTTIRRKPEAIEKILKERIDTKEVLQSIVFAISLTEDYINDVLTLVLEAYPRKLLISSKGNQQNSTGIKSISLQDLIEAKTAEEVFSEQARSRARDALYATPQQYAEYMNSVLGFRISQDVLNKYIEIKATRDLYIHGDGKINSIYLQKVGALNRGSEGDVASLGQKYFKDSVGVMKEIFSTIYKGMLASYGESLQVEAVLKRRSEAIAAKP